MTLALLFKIILVCALVSGVVLALSFVVWTLLFAFVVITDLLKRKPVLKYSATEALAEGITRDGHHIQVGIGAPLDENFEPSGSDK